MARLHHLLVIFWILEDRYAVLAKTIAKVISKYRRLVRLQQYKVFKEDGGARQHV